MPIYTNYTQARANFADLLNKAVHDREIVYVSRRNSEDVAILAASELTGLLETAHLLSSPKNAERLLNALNRAHSKSEKPKRLETVKKELGLEK